MKNISFLSENFQFLEVKFSILLKRRVFAMALSVVALESYNVSSYIFVQYMCLVFMLYALIV